VALTFHVEGNLEDSWVETLVYNPAENTTDYFNDRCKLPGDNSLIRHYANGQITFYFSMHNKAAPWCPGPIDQVVNEGGWLIP